MSNAEPLPARLRDRLRCIAASRLKIQTVRGALIVLAAACISWLLAASVEAIFWMSPLGRLFALTAVVLAVGVVAIRYVAYPLIRLSGFYMPPSAKEGAHLVSGSFPASSSRALTLLDLLDGRNSSSPSALLSSATYQLAESLEPTPLEDAVTRQPIRETASFAAVPTALFLLGFLLFPSTLQDASERLLSPGTMYEAPAPFSMSVEPGDAEFLRGDTATFTAITSGDNPPEQVSFLFRGAEGDETQTREAEYLGDGTFQIEEQRVRHSFEYRATAEGVESDWYRAEVKQRPVIQDMNVRVTPPPYTGESARELPSGRGDVHALAGSNVQIDLRTEGPVPVRGYVVFNDADSVALAIHPEGATGSFTLDREGHYAIHLEDEEGRANHAPIKHNLKLKEDLPPSIRLVSPGPTSELSDAQTTLLQARIQDDYGFSELRLFYRVEDSAEFESIELPLESPQEPRQLVEFPWRLQADTGLDLGPGDSVEYYLKVWDNDRPGGFKTDRTYKHRLYVPSAQDRSTAMDEHHRRLSEHMQAVFGEEEAFRAATDDFRSETQRGSSREGYETSIGDLGERHRDLAQQTEELTRDIESAMREMTRPQERDDQSADLLRQLQEMSETLGIEDLGEALRQLQESIQQNERGAQDAMQQLAQQEQSLQNRLEQMKSMMEQLKTRQQLDALVDESGDLAAQQSDLADRSRQASEQEDVAETEQQQMVESQESLSDAVDQLHARMQEALEDMQNVRGAPQDAMQQMMEQAGEQDLPTRMQESAEQLKSGDFEQAEAQQSEMTQIFQDMQQQFGEMQEQMSQQQEQLNVAAIRQALRNTMALSEQQEQLLQPAQNLSPGSDEQRERSAKQHRLYEGLNVVSDTLHTLVRSVPMISGRVIQESEDALQSMEAAVEQLTGRSPSQATRSQEQALTNLNTLALTLSHLLENMQDGDSNGSGGSSMEQMAQQLQEMAGDQQQINEEIQQMLNEMQGERLSADQQERMEQLAEQHQRLRNEIERRRDEGAGAGDADLDHLEQTADDLEEVISDLRRDRLSQEDQQEIVLRLLETRRSMRDQDQSPERRAEVAQGTYERNEPPQPLPEMGERERMYQDILRSLRGRYSPAYEALIRRYLEEVTSTP